MIPARGWIVVAATALLIIAMGRAGASDLPPGVTCPDVRAVVASVAKQTGKTMKESAVIVEAIARAGGATEQQIKAAKRCLAK